MKHHLVALWLAVALFPPWGGQANAEEHFLKLPSNQAIYVSVMYMGKVFMMDPVTKELVEGAPKIDVNIRPKKPTEDAEKLVRMSDEYFSYYIGHEAEEKGVNLVSFSAVRKVLTRGDINSSLSFFFEYHRVGDGDWRRGGNSINLKDDLRN